VPDPVAPAFPSIVIHGTPGVEVHAQVAAEAVTVMSPEPPSLGNDPLVGATVKVQGGGAGAAACVIVTGVPATTSVPDRAVVDVFGATV
jgi:hypothetical protein